MDWKKRLTARGLNYEPPPKETMKVGKRGLKQADERLDEVDFYNLMQAYRITPMTEQEKLIERYEEVKSWIRKNYA